MTVRYAVVVSVVAVTLHWQTRPHPARGRLGRIVRGLPATGVTLVFGWWGVPWGPVRTAQAVVLNLSGGLPEPTAAGAVDA